MAISKASDPGQQTDRRALRTVFGRCVIALIGLAQVALSLYWFVTELGYHSALPRLDLAGMMLLLLIFGIGLIFASRLAFFLSLSWYAIVFAAYAIKERIDMQGLALFLGPMAILLVGGFLYAPARRRKPPVEQTRASSEARASDEAGDAMPPR